MDIPKRALDDYELECQMLHDFFSDISCGTFVEVGSNHPTVLNLTYPLEQEGWSWLLVEPIPELAEQLRVARQNAEVCQAACSSPEKAGKVNFYVSGNSGDENLDPNTAFGGASCLEKNIDDYSTEYSRTIQIECVPLKELLCLHKIKKIGEADTGLFCLKVI